MEALARIPCVHLTAGSMLNYCGKQTSASTSSRSRALKGFRAPNAPAPSQRRPNRYAAVAVMASGSPAPIGAASLASAPYLPPSPECMLPPAPIAFKGLHHVGLICANLEKSMQFYEGMLGAGCFQGCSDTRASVSRVVCPFWPDLHMPAWLRAHAAGLAINPDRPDARLPYRGAWLWVGPDMVHLMELPNPDPMEGRPEVGGWEEQGQSAGQVSGSSQRVSSGGAGRSSSVPLRPSPVTGPLCPFPVACAARRAGPPLLHRGREHRAAG